MIHKLPSPHKSHALSTCQTVSTLFHRQQVVRIRSCAMDDSDRRVLKVRGHRQRLRCNFAISRNPGMRGSLGGLFLLLVLGTTCAWQLNHFNGFFQKTKVDVPHLFNLPFLLA